MPVTGNKFVLDTNIISALFKGESAIADKIDKAKEVHIPIIVLGELYYGASCSTHVEKNISDIQNLLTRYSLLFINREIAVKYGNIKASLRKKGKPIPENDIWISAIASHYNLTIATRDNHFKQVEGISIVNW